LLYCLFHRDAARGEKRGRARAPSTPCGLGDNTMEAVDGIGGFVEKSSENIQHYRDDIDRYLYLQ